MNFTYAQARKKCRQLGIPEDREGLAAAFRALGRERRQREEARAKHEGLEPERMPAWQRRAIEREKAKQRAMGID